jgi:hypothetical protein
MAPAKIFVLVLSLFAIAILVYIELQSRRSRKDSNIGKPKSPAGGRDA